MGEHGAKVSVEQKALIEALYREHHRALIAFLSRMPVEGMEPEDIAQEAYYRLARMDNFSDVSNPRAFLFKTATNLVNDVYRRNFRRSVKETIDFSEFELAASDPSQERIVQSKQEVALIRKALKEMNPNAMAVLTLHRFGGRSQKQIAAELNLSLSMVEKYMNRAVNFLRERVLAADGPRLQLVGSDKPAPDKEA